MLRMKMLAEDTAPYRGHLGEHGFSLWVEREGEDLLFDAGQGLAILHNARALKVDWEKVKKIAISHGHYDHTEGLPHVLSQTRAKVFLHPQATVPRFKRTREGEIKEIGPPWRPTDLVEKGALLHYLVEAMQILPGMWLTGPIPRTHAEEVPTEEFLIEREGAWIPDPFLDDQALVLEEERGLAVVLGCGHAGLINTLDYARELTGQNRIGAVIGGIHLLGASAERIDWTIEALKEREIRHLALSHCTGFSASARFYQAFGDRVRPLHVGDTWPGESD
ncbi:MAG: MBL fold metallo-hydrolase [candidate division NC10 bacterium]|nr:MBL fold metallo-hydrolase [candidate division NC10 bacterium]